MARNTAPGAAGESPILLEPNFEVFYGCLWFYFVLCFSYCDLLIFSNGFSI